MAKYRNIELDDALAGVIRHMDSVEEYREVLQGLQVVWDNLTLLGQMSGTGTDMSGTRQAFQQLSAALLNQLAAESLRKCVQEIGAKAQVAIDILVRNLYERTADIGFLATDQDVRDFLRLLGDDPTPDALAAARARLTGRFSEYVAKYSVYSDIVLLAPDGQVLLRLDPDVRVASSRAALLETSLATSAPYVETFGCIDLFPGDERALVYSCRVEDVDGTALGVLCLCFRFHNEMEGIFAKLTGPAAWSVVTLLDASGRVIASSDHDHVPVGARLALALGAPYRIVRFAGQEYIVATREAHGYQGYAGPGWTGHVLLPLHHAFAGDASHSLTGLAREVLDAVMRGASLFGESLRRIPRQAEAIQGDLNRSVWNGNVRQAASSSATSAGFSKILLWEVSNTGARTKDVFERSIDNLHHTVLSATLQDRRLQAGLAIDIMDRNLYERANDCRWWALTSVFRSLLDTPDAAGQGAATIQRILACIHGLYTVYSNLLVFDLEGRVIAVSKPAEQHRVGQLISEDWQRRALELADGQGYTVSDFVPTPLYGDRPTYVYGAAIRSPDGQRVVGGVGIVFDAEPQFAAMLRDALPRDASGQLQDGAVAVFVGRDGAVIAGSDPQFPVGSRFPLSSGWFEREPGSTEAGVVTLDGQYYAIGASASAGYREYKGDGDPYRNDVVALVLTPLCEARRAPARTLPARLALNSGRGFIGARVELATFLIGTEWYGIRTSEVVEAIDAQGLTAVPGAGREFAGYLLRDGLPLAVFELRHILGQDAGDGAELGQRQVVVVRHGAHSHFGIMVDALGEIPEVPVDRVSDLPDVLGGGCVLADAIVPLEGEDAGRMMLVLGAARMYGRLAVSVTEPWLKIARSPAAVERTSP